VRAEVIGREEEVAAVDSVLSSVDSGPAGILLTGEAGIGKTTLWAAGVDIGRKRSMRVLAARPAETEAKLALAGVGDLLEPFLDDVLRLLPPPQRRVLEIGLLIMEADRTPDPRAVAVAFLTALRGLAGAGPVLLAVDDLQWLDAASEGVLRFAVRRLRDEPVALLVAQRGADTASVPLALDRALASERFTSIHVGPLALGALHRILHDRLGTAFPRPTLVRLHDASGGNPFFALEMARALERGEFRPLPGGPLPVPPALGELVRDRVAALPPETREVLTAAAALSEPRLSVLQAALGDDAGSRLRPALDADIVSLEGDVVRFAHPLLASAAYSALDQIRQRELHRRLADIVGDVEERARHLAAGTETADPVVADALELAARRARFRGAPAAAAELAEKALHVTPPDLGELPVQRAMEAAAYHFEAGDPARARRLLEHALAAVPPGHVRAEARVRLARVHAFEADLPRAAALYREALAEAHEDSETRLEAEAGLAVALMRMLKDLPFAARHAREASRRAEVRGDLGTLSELLGRQALIEGLRGDPDALEHANRAAELEARATEPDRERDYFFRGVGGAQFTLGVLLSWRDDLESALAAFDAAGSRASELGDDSALPLLLRWRAFAGWLAGGWESALEDAVAGYDWAVQTGQPAQRAVLAGMRSLVLAHMGRAADARDAADEALRLAHETGSTFATLHATSALGFLELSIESAAEADRLLGPLVEHMEAAGVREPGVLRFLPDEIEALIALGRLEEAEALLGRLERRARELDRSSALAATARCRALLDAAHGDLAAAVSTAELALTQHERLSIPFERARTLLVLGETRRRAKQKRLAREAIEAARSEFERLGASLWVDRARAELARVGGRAPSPGELTPAERRIAELVAEGLTNKEVASRLFLAPKTVEAHLSRIYGKLGVRSRAELARKFRDA
jgi:DNA-binding CsgD family transcriptional regulator